MRTAGDRQAARRGNGPYGCHPLDNPIRELKLELAAFKSLPLPHDLSVVNRIEQLEAILGETI
mgnify:CR=1 FL=1